MFLMVGLLLTGCSGIHASKSISPASFLLPGLLKAEPAENPNREFPGPQGGTELTKI
jgi:hypothetical protein